MEKGPPPFQRTLIYGFLDFETWSIKCQYVLKLGTLNLLTNVKPTKNVFGDPIILAGREAGRRLSSSTHAP